MLNQIIRGMWDGHRGSNVEHPNDSMWYWVQASFLAVCGHTLMTVCGMGSGVEYPNDRDIQVPISASFHSCAKGLRCLLGARVCLSLFFNHPLCGFGNPQVFDLFLALLISWPNVVCREVLRLSLFVIYVVVE